MRTRNVVKIEKYQSYHEETGQRMIRWYAHVQLAGPVPAYLFSRGFILRKEAVSDALEKLRALERYTQLACARLVKKENT